VCIGSLAAGYYPYYRIVSTNHLHYRLVTSTAWVEEDFVPA
jgi:hypothetical protein